MMSGSDREIPFRRTSLLVLLVGISLVASSIQPVAVSARESCPAIKIFGVHGANEAGPGVAGDSFFGVGETVWNIWTNFSLTVDVPGGIAIEAVDFPRTPVDLPAAGLRSSATFFQQIAQLEPGAEQAAAALAEQVSDTYIACGDRTRYLFVGYSQGAWAIDKALRKNLAPDPLNSSVEALVAGVLLLGDPAWPANEPYPDKKGVASTLLNGAVSSPYAPKRFANRLTSYCVSFAGDVYDPICWYNGDFKRLQKDLHAHFTYKDHPEQFVSQLAKFVKR